MLTGETLNKILNLKDDQPADFELFGEAAGQIEPTDITIIAGWLNDDPNELSAATLSMFRSLLGQISDWRAVAMRDAINIGGVLPALFPSGGIVNRNEYRVNFRGSAFDNEAIKQIAARFEGQDMTKTDAIRFALTFTAIVLNGAFEGGKHG